jgi:hypothetical protein
VKGSGFKPGQGRKAAFDDNDRRLLQESKESTTRDIVSSARTERICKAKRALFLKQDNVSFKLTDPFKTDSDQSQLGSRSVEAKRL